MKKVLFTATVDSHINHFHLPYLKMFKENGFEVHVATNTSEDIKYCDKKHKISISRNPFKPNNLIAIKQLKDIIDKENFDIIHTHTPMGSVVTRLAAIKSRKNKTKVIYTVHGFHFFKGSPILNWLLYYPIEKCLSKYTDTLITINKEDYNLAKTKMKTRNIEYVAGVGIDSTIFDCKLDNEQKQKIKDEFNIKKDSFVISQIGELNKNKNQIVSIKAMNQLVKSNPNIHLILAGEGNLRKYYESQVKKLGLENNIHFAGYVSDIEKIYQISDLCISTSKREGLPVNIIQALTSETLCVVSNCRGSRDLIKNGINGYVTKIDDVNELVMAVKNIIEKKMIINKIEVEEYSIGNVMKKMKEIYKLDNKIVRVLHVIRAMDVGGAETLIMNLYRNIDRNKVQFDFLVSKDGYFDDEIKKMGANIYKVPYITEVGQSKYVKYLKNVFKEHTDFDIIHSHIDQVSGIILETAKKCNIPVRIAHSHSTRNCNGFVARLYKIYLQNKINKNATNFFACSCDAARWLFKGKSDEAIIVDNGIEMTRFEYSDQKKKAIRSELGIPDDYTVIGHVGAFRKEKNHEFLIDVYSEYLKLNPKSYLVMVGDGELKEKIQEKVNQLNIMKNVKFVGIRADTDYMYCGFDIFCMPSFFEGMSIALIEAQKSGLKCVASNTICGEVKQTGNIDFIDLDIKKWINTLNSNSYKKYDRKNIKMEKYDIINIAKKIEDIYQKLERK